jgi:peptidoglycan L-alanyl-D-glutamate endopeptidase CwlK
MQAGWVLLYFLSACAVLAWLVWPHGRRAWPTRGRRWWWREHVGDSGPWWRQRWVGVIAALVIVCLPMSLVLIWSRHDTRVLEGFDDRVDVANTHVGHLLEGEQLVPPPALPPDVFVTAEVQALAPMLSTADRQWDLLEADFVQRLLMAFKIMKEQHGYDMALLEGYRSPQRQAMLASQGSQVTMAGAWQSYHQYGLAADCAFYRQGKLLISEKDPWAMRGYQLYGQVAEQLGLTWGGRWKMMDLGHVEWRKPGAQSAMKAVSYR